MLFFHSEHIIQQHSTTRQNPKASLSTNLLASSLAYQKPISIKMQFTTIALIAASSFALAAPAPEAEAAAAPEANGGGNFNNEGVNSGGFGSGGYGGGRGGYGYGNQG